LLEAVVRIPRVEKLSFTAIGIPKSGSSIPSLIAVSAFIACPKASFSVTVTKEFNFPSILLIWSRQAFVNSTDENFLFFLLLLNCSFILR